MMCVRAIRLVRTPFDVASCLATRTNLLKSFYACVEDFDFKLQRRAWRDAPGWEPRAAVSKLRAAYD
jgi:hypothetical protein